MVLLFLIDYLCFELWFHLVLLLSLHSWVGLVAFALLLLQSIAFELSELVLLLCVLCVAFPLFRRL